MYIFGKCIFVLDTCCQQFGEYVSVEYISWYWISCQQLGEECKLEGFCVPFGHRVGECTFLENAYFYSIYAPNNLGSMCQLNVQYTIYYICWYWIYHANNWGMNVNVNWGECLGW